MAWFGRRAWLLALLMLAGSAAVPWSARAQAVTPIPVPWWIPDPSGPPDAGTVLFEADWSDLGSHVSLHSRTGWQVINDSLVGTGSMRPLQTHPPPQDYFVEAAIQRVGQPDGVFELILWEPWYDRYVAHFENGEVVLIDYRGGITGATVPQIELTRAPFDPGDALHVYRGEVQRNDLRLFVDGTLVVSQSFRGRNSSFAAPGVYSNTELRIHSFRMVAL
jgi:hypothetical protein